MKGLKKHFKVIAAAVAAVAVAVPCAAMPVFANSGPRYEYGVSGAGVVTRNQQSVLAVESEKLTFNIVEFPEYYDLSSYGSTVTAEYKFVNTSDETVTSSMAFPVGVNTNYYGEVPAPEIKVNGDAVKVQTRHTYGGYYNFAEDVKYILDDYYTDGFYTPEMQVTRYKVTVNVESNGDYRLVGEVKCGDGARFIVWNGTENSVVKYLSRGENNFDIFVAGDSADFNCVWHFEKYKRRIFLGGNYVRTDDTFPINITAENATLKQLTSSFRPQNSAVSELDWYNACVRNLGSSKYVPLNWLFGISEYNFRAWYVYDVRVDPNGSFTNTVTAPLLPSINYNYSPYVYEYEYYLSPAASWKSFGRLDVEVKTDKFMSNPSLPLESCDGGYKATFDTLPEGELEFSLCSVENPSYRRPGVVLIKLNKKLFTVTAVIAAIALAGFITGMVYLIVASKKK